MNADWQSITALAIVVGTGLVFAVRTAIRIRRYRKNPESSCGEGCGCSGKFKPTK